MKNHIINTLIGLSELLLFIWGLIIPNLEMSVLMLLILAFLYLASIKNCTSKQEDYTEVFKKYYGFPLFLLIFYIISPEPTLKFSILIFSAQASLKMIQNSFLSYCGKISPY